MKLKRLAAAFLFAAACVLLCACGSGPKEPLRDAVSVWYLEGDPLADGLSELAREYNENVEGGLLIVALRPFPDEDALGAAFETAQPDLLLCSWQKAEELYQRGVLRDIGAALKADAPQYSGELCSRFASVGRGFFPVGSAVQLLYWQEGALTAQQCSDPDALFSLAALQGSRDHLPFFTADSYSALFYELLLSLDTEFHADRQMDLRQIKYIYLYNLLAEAAYEGSLVSMDYSGVDLVSGGYLKCAAVFSDSLTDAPLDGFSLSPLPHFQNGRGCLGEMSGLAVTARSGRSIRSISAFLRFLFSESRAAQLSLQSGLLPSMEGVSITGEESGLAQALMQVYTGYTLHLPDVEGDYVKNRASFETDYRKTLGLFA